MTPKEAFAARIARINSGGANRMNTLFIGMDEAIEMPSGGLHAPRGAAKRVPSARRMSPAGLLVAFGLGILALAAAHLVRYLAIGTADALSFAQAGLVPDAAAATGLALALAWLAGLRRGAHLMAAAAGIGAMFALMHGTAQFAPEVYAGVLSPEILDHVVQRSQALTRQFATITL